MTELAPIAAGDVAAELYTAHAPKLLRHLRFLTGDPALAEDLLHETFASAVAALSDFRGDASAATWLRTIAIHHVRRSARRRGLRPSAESAGAALRSAPVATDEEARRAQTLDHLDAALAGLSSEQREAFVLRVIEAMPLAACAEALGAPVSTVSHRARAAEEHVRAYFNKLEPKS